MTACGSSAQRRVTRPLSATTKRPAQGVAEATATQRSRAKKLLPLLGAPPRMPAPPWRKRPSASQASGAVVEASSAAGMVA